MSQTVARRNRTWTPSLKEKLVREVNGYVNAGDSKSSAFVQLSNDYGVTAATLSTMYYKIIAEGNGTRAVVRPVRRNAMSFVVPSVKKNFTPQNAPAVADAIILLKKFGATISF